MADTADKTRSSRTIIKYARVVVTEALIISIYLPLEKVNFALSRRLEIALVCGQTMFCHPRCKSSFLNFFPISSVLCHKASSYIVVKNNT